MILPKLRYNCGKNRVYWLSIAIFGGSFDPPHTGHRSVVTEALKELSIDKLYIVPAYLSPFKSNIVASGELRASWLRRIFADNAQVEVSDFEIMQDRAVYTIETVLHFRQIDPHIYLIIGADNLDELHKWHNFELLDTLVTWVVATRSGDKSASMLRELQVDCNISSTELRDLKCTHMIDNIVRDEIIDYYKTRKR